MFARSGRGAIGGAICVLLVSTGFAGCKTRSAQSEATNASATPTEESGAALDQSCRDGILSLVRAAPTPVEVVVYSSGGAPVLDRARATVLDHLHELERGSQGKLHIATPLPVVAAQVSLV